MVVAIDARRQAGSAGVPPASSMLRAGRPRSQQGMRWNVLTYGGTRETELDAEEWAARVESLGAGEILLTSMDADGTQRGFDCELTAAISKAVHIPVIASGGAGSLEHFADVFLRGAADAALAASIFHFGQHSIRNLKDYLLGLGVPVRLLDSPQLTVNS